VFDLKVWNKSKKTFIFLVFGALEWSFLFQRSKSGREGWRRACRRNEIQIFNFNFYQQKQLLSSPISSRPPMYSLTLKFISFNMLHMLRNAHKAQFFANPNTYIPTQLILAHMHKHTQLILAQMYIHTHLILAHMYLHTPLILAQMYIHTQLILAQMYLHTQLILVHMYIHMCIPCW
jgi:hypothetical protein